MNRIIFISAGIFLLLQAPLASQQTQRDHAISANPFGFAFGFLTINYEWRSGMNSFVVRGDFFPERKDWAAFGLGGAYRWYLTPQGGRRALAGLAAGPFAEIVFWRWRGKKDYAGGTTSLIFGGELSYKWIWTNFMLEPTFSIGFVPVNTDEAYYRGGYWGFGLSLGYAW